MYNNKVLVTFISASFLITLWYGGNTAYKLYEYYSLTETTNPIEIEWKVNRKASDRFYVSARYVFITENKKIVGISDFTSVMYKSPEASFTIIEENRKKKWSVWYSPKNTNLSTLQKSFPWKACIYSIILLIIALYFVWLRIYVGKFGV